MRKLKGFTLIELLIVVAIIAILAAIAVPNFLEAQIRSKVSRVRSDQRSVATAVEAYYVDNNVYPGWAALSDDMPNGTTPNLTLNANSGLAANGGLIRTFAIAKAEVGSAQGRMSTLTTPIAYMTSYPRDPFMGTKGATFGYYSDPGFVGWIMYSVGPDGDEANSDLNKDVESVYIPSITQPSVTLTTGASADTNRGAYTYDPTNGTTSSGEIIRVKQ